MKFLLRSSDLENSRSSGAMDEITTSFSKVRSHLFLLGLSLTFWVAPGHEDLRQDERVMQLFGLVNTLLGTDPECFKRHLTIVKYPVIPLSPNSGLLGWVDSTDTLHVLIKNYRDSRKILLNIEHRLILQVCALSFRVSQCSLTPFRLAERWPRISIISA